MPVKSLRILMVSSALPPVVDGIGDHAALMAESLAAMGHSVTCLVPSGTNYADISGVAIKPSWSPKVATSVIDSIVEAVRGGIDVVYIHYNPFCYGKWGRNLALLSLRKRIRAVSPAIKLAVMIHERHVPLWPWRFTIMSAWQRPMYASILKQADQVFVSTGPWMNDIEHMVRPGVDVTCVPIGSSAGQPRISRTEARAQRNLPDDVTVVGVFGMPHVSKGVDGLAAILSKTAAEVGPLTLLAVGGIGKSIPDGISGVTVVRTGILDARGVSDAFMCLDAFLCPFSDGISTRRSSMTVALAHGIPVVSNVGDSTVALFEEGGEYASAFTLAADTSESALTAALTKQLSNRHDWDRRSHAARALYRDVFSYEVTGMLVGEKLLNLC
jgi:glycosyltransferase involved in cell wall biosynthesis